MHIECAEHEKKWKIWNAKTKALKQPKASSSNQWTQRKKG